MIVVTGATGQLGRLIVERLLERFPASRVGASVRDPGKADFLTDRGVRVRRGDFDDADGLVAAFEGAEQVLVVSSDAAARGGDPVAQHRNAIEAARSVGARRVVYTSHMAASESSAFPPMRTHFRTEALLGDAGIAWTSLRNGFYAGSVPRMIGDAVETGVLAAPEDGPVSWTAHDDLAIAAVEVLVQEGRFEGPTPPLTASHALDLEGVAAVLADLHGRPIRRELVDDDRFAAGMAARGVPPAVVDITSGFYRAARAGEFSAVDPTLALLLGREPTSLRNTLAAAVTTRTS